MKHIKPIGFVILSLCCNSISAAATSVIQQQIEKNCWHFYQFDMKNPSKLTIRLRKISDDVDLYVSRTKKPTQDDYICAPKRASAMIETCQINSQTPGKWYIGIYGKTTSEYQLGIKADNSDLITVQDIN